MLVIGCGKEGMLSLAMGVGVWCEVSTIWMADGRIISNGDGYRALWAVVHGGDPYQTPPSGWAPDDSY